MSGQIVSLHEITGRLGAETGCGPEIAGTFLKEFSAVISQGLAADGVVCVAGLGIFRVVSDVNGNPSVEFAPDASLAGKVNEPFAMFESVELADSLTEAELNPSAGTQLSAEAQPAAEEIPQSAEDARPMEDVHPEDEVPEDSADAPEPTAPGIVPPPLPPRFLRKEKSAAQLEDEMRPQLAESRSKEIRTGQEAAAAEENATSPAKEDLSVQDPVSYPPVYSGEPQPQTDANPLAVRLEPESSVTIQRVGHTTLTLVVTAIAACLLGLILGYLSYKWLNNNLPGNVEFLEDGILIRHDSGIVEEEIVPFDNAAEDSLEMVRDIPADSSVVPEAAETPAQQTAQPAAPAVVTDTVGPGNYLSVMARRHYGNAKFWVYIYLENKDKIRNPDNLEDGMVLVIPPASKYGIDASDPASLKKAEKEAYKVMPG